MLKILLKKQLAEVFKSYFYDAKKNRMRSKWAIACWIVFFLFIMVGVLGGMFTVLALSLCPSLSAVGAGWLYYALMGGLAIMLGAFGSVFNTYAGLYLAKDNDLLLSLPIPARTIVAARLLNVYLLGAMYVAVVMLPTMIVHWLVAGATAARVLCALLLLLLTTVIVLLLSCLLGWVVARISLRLRHRNIAAVLVSLLLIGAYYFFYFKANDLIRELLLNAVFYGEKIKGAAYGVYLFGRVGEGDWAAAGVCCAVVAALAALLWRVMSRSFLKIATASGNTEKRRYVEKPLRQRSPFAALLVKEFGRFSASANYMLNCGLGVILIPAGGVLLLIKGRLICRVLGKVFSSRPGFAPVLLAALLCVLSSMNDMAAPSVSLEGKSLWIPQSLPVEPRTVLRAKLSVELLLTLPPMLFACVCALLAVEAQPAVKLLLVLTPLCWTGFKSCFGLYLGVRMPLLNWTEEIAPIKQSGAVAVVLFGAWGLLVGFTALYLLFGYRLGAALWLGIWASAFAAAALWLLRWLDTKGARLFSML